jgi:hypothetical protein
VSLSPTLPGALLPLNREQVNLSTTVSPTAGCGVASIDRKRQYITQMRLVA